MYCKELTKKQLEEYGFISVEYDNTNNEWIIMRNWYKNSSRDKIVKRVKITEAIGKHKYTSDKVYKKITFAYNSKGISIPLSRFVYAWYYGVPEGYDVEHINNDAFDNRLENLRLCTRAENLAKRFSDNPANWTNQYGKTHKQNEQENI